MTCPRCQYSGTIPEGEPNAGETCPKCDGSGLLCSQCRQPSDTDLCAQCAESEKESAPTIQMPAMAARASQCPGCYCYEDGRMPCLCPDSEKALRICAAGRLQGPLAPAEREECLGQIAAVEGYRREDYETAPDEQLAGGVLSAWTDYARDKGLL